VANSKVSQNPALLTLLPFEMRDLTILLVHLITTVIRITRPGGLRSVVAESVLIKHQLLIVNRSRRRAPNLRVLDRLIAGFCSLWIKPKRLLRSAIALKPSTLLSFHHALVQRKSAHHRIRSSGRDRRWPGTLSDVQSSDAVASGPEIFEFGS
jgi:putative transposase